MTITSASANSAIQYANNSQDYSSVTGEASLASIMSQQPSISPETLAPKPNNHLMLKAALAGATLGLVGPLAAPMLGNIVKSAFGFAKNLLPQAGDVASHLAQSGMGQGGIEKAVEATVSKVAGEKAGKVAGKVVRDATEKVIDKKPLQNKESALEKHKKQEEKSEARQEKQSKAREEAQSNKKPDFQSDSQYTPGGTSTALEGKSGEGFQFKPD